MPKKGHQQAESQNCQLVFFDINRATWKMLLFRAARFTWPNLGPLAKDLTFSRLHVREKCAVLAPAKTQKVKGPKGNI